jgi:hypothetical protein
MQQDEERESLKSSLELERETTWKKRQIGTKIFQCHCGQWGCLKHSRGVENAPPRSLSSSDELAGANVNLLRRIRFNTYDGWQFLDLPPELRITDADGVTFVDLIYENDTVKRMTAMDFY